MVIYDRYDIVFQEVPGEISLSFSLKNCPNMCEGCHSPHLREKNGNELTATILMDLITKYHEVITCVLFMGGDADHLELFDLLSLVRERGLKTCVYSGMDFIDPRLIEVTTFYKIGSYKEHLGGLEFKTTNQKMYEIKEVTSIFNN